MPRNIAPIQQPVLLNNGRFENIWVKWLGIISRAVIYNREDGSVEPVSIADAVAANNSIYYSTDQSKLVYKDFGGVVNDLY
jgi:hypothetical protein